MIVFVIALLWAQYSLTKEWTPNFYDAAYDGQTGQMRHATKEIYKLHLTGTMSKIPIFMGLSKEKKESVRKKLENAYKLAPDGTLYDYSQALCMIIKKNNME